MKKITAILTSIVMILSMFILPGCSSETTALASTEPEVVACVLGVHGNSAQMDYLSNSVKDAVEKSALSFGNAYTIVVDGDPWLGNKITFDIGDQYKQGSPRAVENNAKAMATVFLQEASVLVAKNPEVDYLSALEKAVRQVSTAPDSVKKKIIVVGTGLSTTGALDFTNNLILADPNDLADWLYEHYYIPDFSGIEIIWQGIGDVGGAQEKMTPGQVIALKNIYTAIITKGGGNVEFVDDLPTNVNIDAASLPDVTVVDLPDDETFETPEETPVPMSAPIFYNIEFVPDEDTFIDPGAAMASLSPVADYMKNNPDYSLLLIGTCAGDDDSEYVKTLSAKRADAVKAALVSMGAKGENITAIGQGCSDKWHIPNVGTDSAIAQRNRKTVLLNADTDEAKEILEG